VLGVVLAERPTRHGRIRCKRRRHICFLDLCHPRVIRHRRHPSLWEDPAHHRLARVRRIDHVNKKGNLERPVFQRVYVIDSDAPVVVDRAGLVLLGGVFVSWSEHRRQRVPRGLKERCLFDEVSNRKDPAEIPELTLGIKWSRTPRNTVLQV